MTERAIGLDEDDDDEDEWALEAIPEVTRQTPGGLWDLTGGVGSG